MLEDFLDIFRYDVTPILNCGAAYGYLLMDYCLYYIKSMIIARPLEFFNSARQAEKAIAEC